MSETFTGHETMIYELRRRFYGYDGIFVISGFLPKICLLGVLSSFKVP